MHYLLLYDYVENVVERRAPHREAHLALAREALARGELLLGGALADPVDGAVLLFRCRLARRRRGVRGEGPVRRGRARDALAHPAVDGRDRGLNEARRERAGRRQGRWNRRPPPDV